MTGASGAGVPPTAPRLRADGQRNRERIILVASRMIAERGVSASLEEIARQAGIGSATLHRHFPSRRVLLEAVLFERVAALCDEAGRLSTAEPPGDALVHWLELVVRHGVTTRGLTAAFLHPGDGGADVGERSATCEQLLVDAAAHLLSAARLSGQVHEDLRPTDLLTLVFGLCVAVEAGPEPVDAALRLLHLAIEGAMPGLSSRR